MLNFLRSSGELVGVVRLVMWLVGAGLFVFVAGIIVGDLLPEPEGLWRLARPHAITATAALVAGLAMAGWVDGAPHRFDALGLPLSIAAPKGTIRGVVLGAGLVLSAVLIQLVFGWLRLTRDAGTPNDWVRFAGGMALLFAIGAASEELLFRGYGFQRLVEWLGIRFAVLVDAALFAALHLGNPRVDVLPLINIGLAGALLAGAYLRTRSLWVAIGLHWSWNWFSILFDRPVSGVEFDAPGYDFLEWGPDLITGGRFGLEGGLLGTVILFAGITMVFRRPFPEA